MRKDAYTADSPIVESDWDWHKIGVFCGTGLRISAIWAMMPIQTELHPVIIQVVRGIPTCIGAQSGCQPLSTENSIPHRGMTRNFPP